MVKNVSQKINVALFEKSIRETSSSTMHYGNPINYSHIMSTIRFYGFNPINECIKNPDKVLHWSSSPILKREVMNPLFKLGKVTVLFAQALSPKITNVNCCKFNVNYLYRALDRLHDFLDGHSGPLCPIYGKVKKSVNRKRSEGITDPKDIRTHLEKSQF